MSDRLMDERLRAAGERWRSTDPTGSAAAGHRPSPVPPAKRSRRRRWAAPTAGAGLVAAVVAVLLVTGVLPASRHAGTAPPPAADVPQRLAGVTWTVAEDPRISLVFLPGAVRTYDGCSSGLYRLRVRGDRMTLGRPIGGTGSCVDGSPSPTAATFARVVSGTFRWSATGRHLTLAKPGAGTLALTNDGSRAPAIDGTQWRLTQISGVGSERVTVPRAGAQLSISAGRFVASDGCNTLSAHATTHLDSFTLGPVAETAIGCLDPTVSAAAAVIDRVLSGTVPFSIRGDELVIARAGIGILVYDTAAPHPAVSITQLTRRVWTLRGLRDTSGATTSSTPAVSLSRLAFSAGRFTVQHRCYTDQGTATASRQTIRLTGVTLKSAVPCPSTAETPAGLRENGIVDALLTGTVAWTVDGTTLTVTKGARALTFEGR